MKRYLRVVLLSMAVSSATPAHATGLADLGQFISQLQGWMSSLSKLKDMPGDLFNSIDYKDLAMRVGDTMLNSGLKMGGVDLNGMLGPILNNAKAFQQKIEQIRADITAQAQNFAKLSFLDGYDKGTVMEGKVALSPELTTLRVKSGDEMAAATKMQEVNVKDVASASQIVEESKTNTTETQKHAEDANTNAKSLTDAADTIQSTREGVQLLVRAQAENIMNQAYSTTALTNAISQQVRETQVSNNMLADMVRDIINDRKDVAMAGIQAIRIQEAQAAAIAQNAQDSIDTAAEGIEAATKVTPNAINVSSFY